MALICQNGHENLDGSLFCEVCGASLMSDDTTFARVCRRCGTPNAPDAQICVNCAAELLADDPNETSIGSLGKARLVLVAHQVSFDVGEKPETIVGRADPSADIMPDVDLTVYGGEDAGVSRIHVKIRRVGLQYSIEDQKSVNNTFLNKQKLEPFAPAALKSGDEIRLGRIILRFEVGI